MKISSLVKGGCLAPCKHPPYKLESVAKHICLTVVLINIHKIYNKI